jgi:hypothetical protein
MATLFGLHKFLFVGTKKKKEKDMNAHNATFAV